MINRMSRSLLLLLATLVQSSILDENFYERLGVEPGAEDRAIRAAFKKKALKVHPDKNPDDDDADQKMAELTEAMDILTNPEFRKAYDADGVKGVEEAKKQHSGTGHRTGHVHDIDNFAMYDDDPQIEVVDYQNWEASHSSTETWFINFYSPDCAHCVGMADAWRRIGDRFHNMIHVGAVNCETNYPVCRAAGIQSLPTILLWPKGGPRSETKPQKYTPDTQGEAGYEYEKLEKFALSYFPNTVQTLLPQDFPQGATLPHNGDTSTQWIIGFCNDGVDCEELDLRLKEVAAITDGLVPVGSINCQAFSDLCQRLGQNNNRGGAIVVYNDKKKDSFTTDRGAKDIAFSSLVNLPPLPKIDLDTLEKLAENAIEHEHVSKIKENPKEYLIMFVNSVSCNHETSLGPGTSNCWKASTALRKVIKALDQDWEYKELTVTTFNCDADARANNKRVARVCKEMAKNEDGKPSLVLLKDGALNAESYFNHIERPNEIIAFVQENFKSIVHELLQEDFDLHVLKEKQTWFVDFNAPWCHHCRDVWPEYNLASKHYDLPKDTEIHFGKINCEEHHEMCTQQHVRSYPTFLLYHKGVRHQFDFASRTAEEFVRFIKEQLEPVVHEYTPEDYKRQIYDPSKRGQMATEDDGDRWVIDFFAPWCVHCTIMSPKYREAASVLRGVMKFGKVNCELDAGFCMQLGIRAYPTIWRFDTLKARNKPTAQYPGLPDPKLILQFALEGVPNFVMELNKDNFDEKVKTEVESESWVVVFHTTKGKCPECERLLMKTKALASRYHEKHSREKQADADPAAAKKHTVNFGKFDCRADGSSYTFCMKERIKKQPMLVFYSGARNQQSILEKEDMLKVISDIDKHIHDDRRELNHPYREKHSFHFHDEL